MAVRSYADLFHLEQIDKTNNIEEDGLEDGKIHLNRVIMVTPRHLLKD